MKPQPTSDAARVTETFLALARGEHDKAKRESGVGPTRNDVRLLRGFREDCEALPSGSLQMEKHVGYRVCGIAGTEPGELLAVYNEIKQHAGTWPAHEQACRDRVDQLLFLARHMIDDIGEIEDALADGSMRDNLMLGVLERVHAQAVEETKHVEEAANAMLGFADHIQVTLSPKIEDKIKLSEATEHDTTNHMQRARLKRMLEGIKKLEKDYRRALGTDEGNTLGRRLARTIYGEAAVAAYDELFDAVYAYKKAILEVAIPFRVPKSLNNRRVQLANAEMAARSGAQGLQHMWVMWATTTAAIGEAVVAFETAKDNKGRAKALEPLAPLLEVWGRMDSLDDVVKDVHR